MAGKRSFKDSLWPPLETERGRKDAIAYGAAAAGWVSLSYLLGIVYMLATGEALFGGPVAGEAELVGWVAIQAVLVVLAAILCWRIGWRRGRIAAWAALAWVLAEILVKLVLAPGSGLIVSAILTLAAIHGVRGTRAHARLAAPAEGAGPGGAGASGHP